MIAIIDYGVGNIKSVLNACKRLGLDAELSKTIEGYDGIILPGVGSFPVAMEHLKELDLIKPLRETKKPILGICLGMQVLFEEGFENYQCEGLGLLSGKIDLIPTDAKLPHMGWNDFDGNDYYFVHSYMAFTDEKKKCVEYGGVSIPAMVWKDNVLGCQFHPEKSGSVGEEILREWSKNL